MRKRLAALVAAYAICFGCTEARRIRRDMTWSPADGPPVGSGEAPSPPGAVRLTFTSAPRDHMVVVSRGLLEQLRRSGRETVSVEFEVHCSASGRRVGWASVRTVAGESVAPVSGIYEHDGPPGPDPLSCP